VISSVLADSTFASFRPPVDAQAAVWRPGFDLDRQLLHAQVDVVHDLSINESLKLSHARDGPKFLQARERKLR
jgi:hypothetical protein